MSSHRDPHIGGQSPRLILDTIRSFPLSVRYDGRVEVENTATGPTLEAFTLAYEAMELEVMARGFACSDAEEHRTLDEHEFRMMVLGAMVDRARILLDDWWIDALWL